ncbi:MAG TPA: zf-HC2 domain-containing protein [Gemmatales bacterium]|nr:zf-HC2 domain-containing protein [Gemmatales bacterium]
MTCREITDFLCDYLDQSLPTDLRSRFEAHLADCPDCVNYLDSYATTLCLCRSAWSAADVPPLPEDLVAAVVAATGSMPRNHST